MTCLICRPGEVKPGTSTLTVERGSMTLVVKTIPARVCGSCGEAYFDAPTTKRLEELVDQVERTGLQVAVRDYAAG